MLIGHRLVHQLVGHGVNAVSLERVGQLVPHIYKILLGLV